MISKYVFKDEIAWLVIKEAFLINFSKEIESLKHGHLIHNMLQKF
jgi:hypothetical protein